MSVPIGCNDKHRRPIHLEDIVRWTKGDGEVVLFRPCLENAQLVFPCSHYDLRNNCEVIKTHDGKKVMD